MFKTIISDFLISDPYLPAHDSHLTQQRPLSCPERGRCWEAEINWCAQNDKDAYTHYLTELIYYEK